MAKPRGRHLRWRVKVTSPLEPGELLRETGWRSRQTAAGCGLPSTLQDSLLSPGQCKHRSSPPWPLELSLPNHHCLGQEGRPLPAAGHTLPPWAKPQPAWAFPWSTGPLLPFSVFSLPCGDGRLLCGRTNTIPVRADGG